MRWLVAKHGLIAPAAMEAALPHPRSLSTSGSATTVPPHVKACGAVISFFSPLSLCPVAAEPSEKASPSQATSKSSSNHPYN